MKMNLTTINKAQPSERRAPLLNRMPGSLALARWLIITLGVLATVNRATADLNDGLLARYSFDGNANDVSRNGLSAQNSGATLGQDRFGNTNAAYAFGVNDYMQVPDPFRQLNFDARTQNYTIATWVKLNSVALSQRQHFIIDRGTTANQVSSYGLYYFGTQPVFAFDVYSGNQSLTVTNTTPIAGDVWYHVAVVVSNQSVRIFVNGADDTSAQENHILPGNFGSTVNSEGIRDIGRFAGSGFQNYLNGMLDDVRIYGRDLSETEIAELYAYRGLQDRLVAWYPFDENGMDASGNGRHAAVVGAPSYGGGMVGNAAHLDGNSYFQCPVNLNEFTNITMAFWARLDTLPPNRYQLVSNDAGFHGRVINVYGDPGRVGLVEIFNSSDSAGNWDTRAQANVWYHIVGVWTAAQTKLYVNGKLVLTGLGSVDGRFDDAPWLKVGAGFSSDLSQGSFDDLRIYDRELSAAEIEELYLNQQLNLNPNLYFGITIQDGVPGQAYRIQTATNLTAPVAWATSITVTQSIGATLWVDTNSPANQPRKFYRVIP